MISSVAFALVLTGVLVGCGGGVETTSTDTAITETISPEAAVESSDTTETTNTESPQEEPAASSSDVVESPGN